jgi:diguanylate cyclase (GGDEF)-like protein
MPPTSNLEPSFVSRLRQFTNLRQPSCVGLLFAILIAAQALGLLTLGVGRWGCSLAESITVLANLLAIACAWIVFRRAQGVSAIFWFLFAAILMVWLVPNAFQAHDTLFDQSTLSDSTWRLLYCLYGAPILMMIFLPDSYRRASAKSEIFLDLFQIAIVVALIYSTFFFLPAQRLSPAAALQRNLSISDAQSLFLLIAVLVRLHFARAPAARTLLLRFAIFLLFCAVATIIGNWIDLHHYIAAAAWFNLGWNLNQAVPALIAVTWLPSPETASESAPEPANFLSFLGANLVLVTMLSALHLLLERWKAADGELITDLAVSAFLLAFTLRLALTQYHQQQEISHRKAAQLELTASHERVGRLLDSARRQTAEITQISELGSLLQACASREEVFRLIPERMRRLFPDASGSISLLSASKMRLDPVAQWGVTPVGQIFSPQECWALRRGSIHVHPRGHSAERCSHLLGEGASICIPLVAIGKTIGTLSIQDNDLATPISQSDSDSDYSARRRHLATAVAEHIALAIANLGLRESLRLQAVRDPLTGLYNRRYMQEFLDRELHSARRKRRPVAVMMLDLDHFKRYNDKFGRSAGDRALTTVGQALLRSVRAEDIACRYGSEEFTLILPECSLSQAAKRADQIRQRLAEICSEPGQLPSDALTISIGIAAFDETTDRVDLLLKFADDALSQAKRAGRNRVVLAPPASALPQVNFTRKENFTEKENAAGEENFAGEDNLAGRDPLAAAATTSD